MTKEDEVRMVAGECLCRTDVAAIAIERCGSAREAIGHLSLQADERYGRHQDGR